jgi:hypothetical protein
MHLLFSLVGSRVGLGNQGVIRAPGGYRLVRREDWLFGLDAVTLDASHIMVHSMSSTRRGLKNWTKIFLQEKKSGREGGRKHQFKSQLIPQNQSVRIWIIISVELNERHLI